GAEFTGVTRLNYAPRRIVRKQLLAVLCVRNWLVAAPTAPAESCGVRLHLFLLGCERDFGIAGGDQRTNIRDQLRKGRLHATSKVEVEPLASIEAIKQCGQCQLGRSGGNRIIVSRFLPNLSLKVVGQ